MTAARKAADAAPAGTDTPAGDVAGKDAPEGTSPAPTAPGQGEPPKLAWFQAPGHVIGFTLPLDPVIQGQVDSGFLTPAEGPE